MELRAICSALDHEVSGFRPTDFEMKVEETKEVVQLQPNEAGRHVHKVVFSVGAAVESSNAAINFVGS